MLHKILHDIAFTESNIIYLKVSLQPAILVCYLCFKKKETRSKAYAFFMSSDIKVLENLSGMVWDSNSNKTTVINRENHKVS